MYIQFKAKIKKNTKNLNKQTRITQNVPRRNHYMDLNHQTKLK